MQSEDEDPSDFAAAMRARFKGPPVQGQTAAAERRREEARRPGIQDRRAIRRSNRTAQLNLKVAPEFKRVVFAGADQEGVLLVEHVERAVMYYQKHGMRK